MLSDRARQKRIEQAANSCLVVADLLALVTIAALLLTGLGALTTMLATLMIVSGVMLALASWAERW